MERCFGSTPKACVWSLDICATSSRGLPWFRPEPRSASAIARSLKNAAAREGSPGRQPGVFSCLETKRRRRDTVTESFAPMGLDLRATRVPGLTSGARLWRRFAACSKITWQNARSGGSEKRPHVWERFYRMKIEHWSDPGLIQSGKYCQVIFARILSILPRPDFALRNTDCVVSGEILKE